MSHSRSVDTDGILITTLSGTVTLKELIGLEDELHSYIRDECVYELILHSDDVKIALGRDESSVSAKTFKSAMKGLKKGAIAFVSDKDYIYGLCRQLEIRADNERVQMRVFRSEESARKWLHKMQSSNKADTVDG